MDRWRFARLVDEAVAELPRKYKKQLHNIAVLVEDRPPERRGRAAGRPGTLLGLYHGVPLRHRGFWYGNIPPDVIVIYREPIEQLATDEDDLRRIVKETVRHEIGHYFGLSEEELRTIEDE